MANLRHGREDVVDEMGLSKSKPVSSLANGNSAARCQGDELKPLDEEEKRLYCWAKKQTSVALSSWESELFAAITLGTRSLGIQSDLMDFGYSCSVTVATDSQSVVDHSQRCIKARWSRKTLVARSSGEWETGAS